MQGSPLLWEAARKKIWLHLVLNCMWVEVKIIKLFSEKFFHCYDGIFSNYQNISLFTKIDHVGSPKPVGYMGG